MSGNENAWNGKKRRLQGSCDACRRRKVKCNSAEMPNNRCTNCINAAIPCVNTRAKAEESVKSTAERLKAAQAEVAKIASTSTPYEPPTDLETCQRVLREVGNYARTLEESLAMQSSGMRTSEDTQPEHDGINVKYEIPSLGDLSLDPLTGYPANDRCYGNFSSQEFSRAAMKHTAETGHTLIVGVQRPDYWNVSPWEMPSAAETPFTFPDKILMETLVGIYFDQINPIWSFLHPPTFRQAMAEGLHFTNRYFGAVVLGVCATASRYSDDPRVFLDGDEHSAGWKWFRQLDPDRIQLSNQEYLYQLQSFTIANLYLTCTSRVDQCWLVVGLGVRLGQSLGLHLKSTYDSMPALEAELYRRAFWTFLLWDTLSAAIKGRPSVSNTSECSLDLPAMCDYEYWGVPNAMQAAGTQSIQAYYAVSFRLLPILERIQQFAHPPDRQTPLEEAIIDLDSALNQWLDEIPWHLKWDSNQENQILLDQSAVLYVSYYHAQLLIHRSFLPALGKPSSANPMFPSMAICANAARSIGHVLEIQARRGRGILYSPYMLIALFDSAVVLLIHVWTVVGSAKDVSPQDFHRATVDVRNCLHVLRLYERRWRIAGRYCDILTAVLNIGRHTSEITRTKRSRPQEEEPRSPSQSVSLRTSLSSPVPESSVVKQLQVLQRSIQDTEHLFTLPLRTDELGRLPVHSSWTFNAEDLSSNPWSLPQSHSDARYEEVPVFGLLPSEMVNMAETSTSSAALDEVGFRRELPASLADVPVGYNWEDWAAYLRA
ncbi:fungal-specific transcription factor domain-containing protein [Mycena amicta]|nr:fungal-specific transcription factor domain-containing protein [Mycena amicta]